MTALHHKPLLVPRPEPIPPLANGDHLTREEFERRYDAMPGLKNAELIEGVVRMPSPVRFFNHALPHTRLVTWMGTYDASTPGVLTGDNGSIRLDMDNMPQPDGAMLILPSHGGQAIISADDYVEKGPELVGEVSASTVSIDLHDKFRIYRRNQVREYIVWRVQQAAVDWFNLRHGQFERLEPDTNGIIRSEVFPGLWLDVPALVRFDLLAVRQVLQEGLASPEHAEFVQKLEDAFNSSSPTPS